MTVNPKIIDRYFELKVLIVDTIRRIELSKMTESELIDEMDRNDKKFMDEMDWLENL